MGIFILRKNRLRCPQCGRCGDKSDGDTLCFFCGCNLITEDEYQANGYHPEIPTVECPYCHSTNTKKIGWLDRCGSVELWGLGSSKIGKQFHCNNCEADF